MAAVRFRPYRATGEKGRGMRQVVFPLMLHVEHCESAGEWPGHLLRAVAAVVFPVLRHPIPAGIHASFPPGVGVPAAAWLGSGKNQWFP